MDSATTSQALAAARQWLQPAIYILLRCGVTWKEFSELARAAYVDVATQRFGKRGRPTNVSRTAMLTGLTRRDVRNQRTKLESAQPAQTGYVTKASLILSAWHLDPDFLDKKNRPRALPVDGAGASFATLLNRCGKADVQPTTLLKELINTGCVRRRADGRLQVLKRDYIPQAMDAQMVRLWGTVLADVGTTYSHNLTRGGPEPPRFERAAVNDRIPAAAVKEFRAFLEQEGQAFLEKVDEWLLKHQVGDSEQDTAVPVTRLGAGVYHLQD